MNVRYTECKICGKELGKWQRITCSEQCHKENRRIYQRNNRRITNPTLADLQKATRPEELIFKPWVPKAKGKPIMTDAEQFEINEAVRSKQNMELEAKIYKKGTLEFEEIAAKCIDPKLIRRNQVEYRVNNVW